MDYLTIKSILDFVKQINLFWTKIFYMYGQRIKEIRFEKNLTQSQLAKILSTTQSTIGKYEREELQPNIEVILQICRTLGVSADYLLGLEDEAGGKTYGNKYNIGTLNNHGKIDMK